jgi:hypothetical protein
MNVAKYFLGFYEDHIDHSCVDSWDFMGFDSSEMVICLDL